MISWDIETSGLDRNHDLITVLGLYDPDAGLSTVLRFVDHTEDGALKYVDNLEELITQLVETFDAADCLVGMNTLTFDLPFVQKQFSIPPTTVAQWALKTFDILEMSRRVLGRTFSLDLLLQTNDFTALKIASGKDAVEFARNGEWDKLAEYCLSDCVLTHQVHSRKTLVLPEGYHYRAKHNRPTSPTRQMLLDLSNLPAVRIAHQKTISAY
jgi:hypothetical protein